MQGWNVFRNLVAINVTILMNLAHFVEFLHENDCLSSKFAAFQCHKVTFFWKIFHPCSHVADLHAEHRKTLKMSQMPILGCFHAYIYQRNRANIHSI